MDIMDKELCLPRMPKNTLERSTFKPQQLTVNLCCRDTRVKLVVVLVRGILFLIICLCAASGEPQLARAARWGLAL